MLSTIIQSVVYDYGLIMIIIITMMVQRARAAGGVGELSDEKHVSPFAVTTTTTRSVATQSSSYYYII